MDAPTGLTAYDIIAIMKAAKETDVVDMTIGDINFQRLGYVPAEEPVNTTQDLLNEAQAGQSWLSAPPPSDVLGNGGKE